MFSSSYLEIDYMSFKSDAVQEIKDHATSRNINIMSAITELYQPPLDAGVSKEGSCIVT